MRPAAVLAILLLLTPLVPAPAAATSDAPHVRLGMDINAIDDLTKAGAKPELAMFWFGAWNHNGLTSPATRWLDQSKGAGVTPVIQWWYWGDSISPSCVRDGCDGRTMADWSRLGQELADVIRARMDGRETIVVIEPEFNKAGIETWSEWDGIWTEHARMFKDVPGVVVVLSFGNWGKDRWGNFPQSVATADMLGFQTMRGSTKSSLSNYLSADDAIAAAAKEIRTRFDRPSLLTDLALSSYPEPEYVGHQRDTLQRILARTPEYHDIGLRGIVFRSLRDTPTMSLDNYFGEAERHWGLWYADGRQKPAWNVWLSHATGAPLDAPQATPGFTAPGFVEAEMLPATTGGSFADAAASDGRAWNLWTNGAISGRVTLPSEGHLDLTVRARGDPAGGVDARMEVRVNGATVAAYDVPPGWANYRAPSLLLPPGDHTFAVRFTNDHWTPTEDRNLRVDRIDGAFAPVLPGFTVPGFVEAEALRATTGGAFADASASGGRAWNLWTNGALEGGVTMPSAGALDLVVRARGDPAEGVDARMEIRVNGHTVGAFDVPRGWADHTVQLQLPEGHHTFAVRFTNDRNTATEDRNLWVDRVDGRPPARVALAAPLAAPAEVPDGATFRASYDVRNDGGSSVTQTFGLHADGAFHGARLVTLAPGASATVAVDLALPAGTHTLEARTGSDGATRVAGDGATATVRALRAGEARLAAPVAAPAEVAAGASFEAAYRVANVGEQTLTRTFALFADGKAWGARSVTLAPGASAEIRATLTLAAGEHRVEARMGADAATLVPGDGATATVRALRAGEARMAAPLQAPSEVEAGRAFRATYRVTNVGEQTLTQTFALLADGKAWGARAVTLAPGASADVAADLTLPAGEHRVEARMGTTSATLVPGEGSAATVRALRAGEARMATALSAPSVVETGKAFAASYRVANVGETSLTQTFAIHADGRLWGATRLTLAPGETREVAASVTLASAGLHTLEARMGADGAVRVPGDGSRATVEARSPAPSVPPVSGARWAEEAEDFGRPGPGAAVSDAAASGGRAWNVWTNGEHRTTIRLDTTIDGELVVRARGDPAAGVWPRMEVRVGGALVGAVDVASAEWRDYVFRTRFAAGDSELSLRFTNDHLTPTEDRNLRLDRAAVVGAPPFVWSREAEDASIKTTGGRVADAAASAGAAWNVWTNGAVGERFDAPAAGRYEVTVVARGTPFSGVQAAFDLVVDGKVVGSWSATTGYQSYTRTVDLAAGAHEVRAVFKNDKMNSKEDRNLVVDAFRVTRV